MSALAKDELIDGKYRIVRFLGKGAWASVYEGVNIRLHRRVAIKVLGQETLAHPGVVERFEREGQAATQIESDHVIDIFDIGSLEDGRPYMVMEFLDGEDLAKTFEKAGILPTERAVFYVVQALTGLAAAHEAGVLHRDIKPANVVLVKKQDREIVKIVDFGISKLHSGAVPQPTAMTQTNAVLGSPVYMSPEQCRGARLMDHRSDLYSLGVVLYEALTGKVPHLADSFNALMFKIALEDVPDPRTHRPDLDPDLVAVLMKALARDTEKRFQSALEFRTALVEWADKAGIDPSAWAIGSVRSIAVTKSGASPKASVGPTPEGDEGKSTRVLTDSGERGRAEVAPTVPAPALTESQDRKKSVQPVSSQSRPTEPSSQAVASKNRSMLIAVVGGALIGLVALVATRKSEPAATPESTKTGVVQTAAPATAEPSATQATTATATGTVTASATVSAAPSETASAAPTSTSSGIVHVGHVATGHAVGVGTKPPGSASAKTAPPASASAKAVIDGRKINTNF